MTLSAIKNRVLRDCFNAGIPYGHIQDVRFFNSRTLWGRCDRVGSGYIIYLNKRLQKYSAAAIGDVLCHEILHTCPRCMNHRGKWKKYARIMNRRGYIIRKNYSTWNLFWR